MRRIALAALAGAALAAAPAFADTTTPGPPADARYVQLSDETTSSQWAYTNMPVKVRSEPSPRGRTIANLRFNTEDGPPEIYLALQQYTAPSGEQWVQIRVPGRPNSRTGWVPRDGLGEFHLVRTQLVIDLSSLRITLYRSGNAVFSAPVGVGKAGTPTPTGKFWIREKLDGFGAAYGPVAFGTGAYSPKLNDWPGGGVVGIHGTNQPSLVPGRPSHGCVRLRNKDILRLARMLPLGTPLLIQ
jgi:hypothetical protein